MRSLFPQELFRYLLPARTALLLIAYIIILVVSLIVAYELRFDFDIPSEWEKTLLENLLWIVPTKLILLFSFGQFGGLLSYFRLPDLYRVFYSLSIMAMFLLYLWYIFEGKDCPPRGVILGDFVISLIFVGGFRVGLRVIRERHFSGQLGTVHKMQRVGIVGAGDVGATLAADMLTKRGYGLRPVVFLDDDKRKLKKHIHGISVVDSPSNLAGVKKKFGIEKIIIAMPSASAMRIREIVRDAGFLGLNAEIVPSIADLTTGRVKASRIRPVEIEDLLGRDSINLDSQHIAEMIEDKVVLVTGAGGSIGSELCRQILANNPKRLLMVEQSEIQLFQIEQNLAGLGYVATIQPLVADILDEQRMRYIIEEYSPSIIFHAAAHKHVFLMERQPGEAVKNNTFGTRMLANLASEFGVNRFVLISTDKAINPTSVMGASKRLAEIYIQAKQEDPKNKTLFMAVRFGNVLGSSGSVVPIFKEQIAKGGPVKVTHAEVTRYFMTIPEAVGLVLQCATQGHGGEIFVLDMGESVRIIDLARQMIELSGFRPEIDIEIEIIGLRPGEKLYEELQHIGETTVETEHSRIMRFKGEPCTLEDVDSFFEAIDSRLNGMERNQIKKMIQELVPEYTPYLD